MPAILAGANSRKKRSNFLWRTSAAGSGALVSVDFNYANVAAAQTAYDLVFDDAALIDHAQGGTISTAVLHEGKAMLAIAPEKWIENDRTNDTLGHTPVLIKKTIFHLSGATAVGSYELGSIGSAYHSLRGTALIYDAAGEFFYLAGTAPVVEGVDKWSCPLSSLQNRIFSVVTRAYIAAKNSPTRYDVWIDGVQRMSNALDTSAAGGYEHLVIGSYIGVFDNGVTGTLRVGRQEWYDGAEYPNPYNLSDPLFYSQSISVFPSAFIVGQGETMNMRATLNGVLQDNADITWGTTTGSIDASGVLTAGVVDGEFQVTATVNGVQGTAIAEIDPFEITDLTDLYAYNRFDDIGGANNDPIDEVPDASGNNHKLYGNTVDNAKRPLLKTNALNGHAIAESDGDDDFLTYVPAPPWGPRTIAFVTRLLDGHTGQQTFASGGGGIRIGTSGGWAPIDTWHLVLVEPSPSFTHTNLEGNPLESTLFVVRVNEDNTITVRRNGVEYITPLNGYQLDGFEANLNNTNFHQHDTDDNAHADVFDPVYCDAALSDADVLKLERRINAHAGGVF